jgi:hypothetical protein
VEKDFAGELSLVRRKTGGYTTRSHVTVFPFREKHRVFIGEYFAALCSLGVRKTLVTPNHAEYATLNRELSGMDVNRVHLDVGGLEAYLISLAEVTL